MTQAARIICYAEACLIRHSQALGIDDMTMRIHATSIFMQNQEIIWEYVQKTKLMEYVCSPFQAFKPINPGKFPERWSPGKYEINLISFGINMGYHVIQIEFPTHDDEITNVQIVRDNGYGKLIAKWDHWIFVEKVDANKTRYTDRIDIDAGILTPAIWLYAFILFAWRQSKWKKQIQRNFVDIK